MLKYRWLVAAGVLFLLAPLARPRVDAQLDGSYLNNVTRRFVTSHLNWATPLAGGPIRAVCIAPRYLAAREIVELAQRLSLKFRVVTTVRAGALSHHDYYEAQVTGTSRHDKVADLLAALKKPADVIVVANFDFSALPPEVQFRIAQRVAHGAGLILTYARPFPLQALLKHPTQDWRGITAGVDCRGLQTTLRQIKSPDLVKTYRFRAGRVVVLAYPGAPSGYYGGPGLTVDEPYSTRWKAHYEDSMVLVARAVRWAAGRKPQVRLAGHVFAANKALTANQLASAGFTLPLQGPAGKSVTAAVRIRDRWNQVRWQSQRRVILDSGAAQVSFHPHLLPSGRYMLDWRLILDHGVEDFGYEVFHVQTSVAGLAITTLQGGRGTCSPMDSYKRGQPVAGALQLPKPPASSLKVQLWLTDLPYGRIWARRTLAWPAGAASLPFQLAAPPLPALAGVLWCQVSRDGIPLALAQRTLFFPRRQAGMYPQVVWGIVPETLAPIYAQQVVDRGDWHVGLDGPNNLAVVSGQIVGISGWHVGLSGSSNGHNAQRMAMLDQRLMPYIARIGLSANTNGWTQDSLIPQQDAGILHGDESFYNPTVPILLKGMIDKRMQNLPTYGPLVYSLGDENYYNYDLGYSPADQTAFIQFERRRYGTITKLNAQWGSHFGSFQQVRQPGPADLKRDKNFPVWLDHRLFVEQQYADVHHFLAKCIRAIDPQARVGAEGSMPGDLAETLHGLQFWGPYSDLIMDEVLRSLAPKDMLRMSWWGGYFHSHGGRSGYPYPLWRGLLTGTVNGDEWYSSEIGPEGFLGTDFMFATYYRHLMPWLAQLKQGQAQLLIDQPLRNDGIALLWSHAAESVAAMDPRFIPPADGVGVLIKTLYQQGLNFQFITGAMIRKGALAHDRVLFLLGASALAKAEISSIDQFVQHGGVVIADVNPGVLNGYGKPLPRSSLAGLFGAPVLNWRTALKLAPVHIHQTIRGEPIDFQAARALQAPEVGPFSWRTDGQGLAILLNMELGLARSTAAANTPFNPFLLKLLKLADIQPAVHISGLTRRDLILRVRRQGDCTTIGLLNTTGGDIGKTATVRLVKPMYIYRVGGGYLGHTPRVSFKLNAPFTLLCAFVDQPKAPALMLERRQLRLGHAAHIAPAGLLRDAVYRLELFGPDRKVLRRRMKVLCGLGSALQRTIRLAYNDPAGRYTVTLTDVRTGLTATATLDAAP